jgi:beta-glucanase (GH16 family)
MLRIAAVVAAFCLTGAMILQMAIFTYRRRVPAMASGAPAPETDDADAMDAASSDPAGKALSLAEAAPSLTDGFAAVRSAAHINNELSVYEKEQVSFSGGDTILLTAARSGDGYVSGMAISTEGYLYGEFSFTITVPEGAGLFPAIWMLSTAEAALPEIDIYEHVGTEPDCYSGVLHYFSGIKKKAYFIYNFENGMPRQYTVGLSWHENLLVWTLDGAEVFRVESHVPDEPMYLIVNLAVGGDWPGDPDENTVFPAYFVVKLDRLEPESAVPRQGG